MRLSLLSVSVFVWISGLSFANAQSILDRPTLLNVDGPQKELQEAGIDLSGTFTQFYQGDVSGSGRRTWEYGGKLDLFGNFDGEKLGLWSGFSARLHGELLYGDDANAAGTGDILPVNTGLGLPRLGGHDGYLSVVFSQALSENVSVSVGNFNMLDAAAGTPLIGGGGDANAGFWNIGLAAPASGITPPYILGANLTIKTEPATFAFFVYDPRNAQSWDVFEKPFSEGITGLASITVPVSMGGLQGYHGVKAAYSTQDGFDLNDIPELALPPEAQNFSHRKSRWYLAYSFQQYLYQDPSNPGRGWGLFGEAGISDANPNVLGWHVLAGIGGNSPIPGREDDRFGLAYFHYGLSDALKDSLDMAGIRLRNESGVEAYYNMAVTPWFRLTADVQYINPAETDESALYLGLRAQVKAF